MVLLIAMTHAAAASDGVIAVAHDVVVVTPDLVAEALNCRLGLQDFFIISKTFELRSIFLTLEYLVGDKHFKPYVSFK